MRAGPSQSCRQPRQARLLGLVQALAGFGAHPEVSELGQADRSAQWESHLRAASDGVRVGLAATELRRTMYSQLPNFRWAYSE